MAYAWYIGPSHAKLVRSRITRSRVYGYYTGVSSITGLPKNFLDVHEEDLKDRPDLFNRLTYTEGVMLMGLDKADKVVVLGKLSEPTEGELEAVTAMLKSVEEANEALEAEKLADEGPEDEKPLTTPEIEENPADSENKGNEGSPDTTPVDSEILTDQKKPAASKPSSRARKNAKKSAANK